MKIILLKSTIFFAVTVMLAAQDPVPAPQRITLPFTDPSRPRQPERGHTGRLM